MCFSMAEDAVNAAVKSGKLTPASGCVTNKLCIVGGEGWEPSSFTVLAQQYKRMKTSHNGKVVPGVMDSAAAKHLSHAYGTMAERVAAIAQVCLYCCIFHIVNFNELQTHTNACTICDLKLLCSHSSYFRCSHLNMNTELWFVFFFPFVYF